jgi:hypothetical protein
MKRRLAIFFLIILLVSTLVLIYKYLFPLIKVSECTNCPEDIKNSVQNKNYKEAKSYLSSHKRLESYELSFTTKGIIVDVIEKKPDVAFFTSPDGPYFLFDKFGTLLNYTPNQVNLPTVTISPSVSLSESEASFISEISYYIFNSQSVKEATVIDQGVNFKLSDNTSIIIPISGDIDLLLGSMKISLSWLKSDQNTSKMNTLDLRFKNPVIKNS